MTLPFRRRHNDAEASHDRARSIIATGFLEPTDPADDAWLETHLEGCPECLAELEGYAADRELLRGLRATSPEPPRDLWARTASAIERDGRHERAGRSSRAGTRVGRVPIGVLSGALVVLVVVATSLFPNDRPLPIGPTPPEDSGVAVVSPPPEATPLAVTARSLSWVEEGSDGTFQLVFADVAEVCVADPEGCAPIEDDSVTRLTLKDEPESVVIAPESDQIVVVTKAASEGRGGEVIIVPVTTPAPTLPPGQTPTPTPAATPTPQVTPTLEPTPTPTLAPGETPGPTDLPIPTKNPDGTFSILSGVVVVGEAAYSPSGEWLAFSARPVDGTTGPDLYTWRVGDPAGAQAATSDHRTFFAGWLGELVLASSVAGGDAGEPAASPDASGAPVVPSAEPSKTPKPAKTPNPGRSQTPGPSSAPGASPGTSPDGSPAPAEDHPVSFLFDPSTATVIDLAGEDIWRPVVNTESGTIVYWSGTLVPDETATGWSLGSGRLVLDRWIDPAATPHPDESGDPGATPRATATPEPTATPDGTVDPLATDAPTEPPGPAGSPVVLAEGPVSDFDIRFDPSGTRLAVWIRDPENENVGTLRLFVLDPTTAAIDPAVDPLPGVPALRGISIDRGRLVWVTPPGQDGEASHVHVLAWTGDDFGQVRSLATDKVVVVR